VSGYVRLCQNGSLRVNEYCNGCNWHYLTTGCCAGMDRFWGEEDIGRQDFVRKEYAFAIELKKNIVPVKHDDF
jgi:hypothetical protein